MTVLNEIDAVVWDFDGVINRNYDAEGFLWFRNIEADLGVSQKALRQALFTGRWAAVLSGEKNVLDVLGEVLEEIEYEGTPQAFFDYWMDRDFVIDTGVLAVMRAMREQGKRQAIGTNNEPLRTQLMWEKHGLQDLADHMFSSGLLGVLKPDPAFFAHVQEALRIAPQRILFIEDTPKNVAAAQAAGWRTHAYGDSSKLQLGNARELAAALGLENHLGKGG